MTSTFSTARVLERQLADPTTSWSVGTFGAVAEFSREPDETNEAVAALTIVTSRGGIRMIERADMRLVASESLAKSGWSQRVALCLSEAEGAMSRRAVLSEIGPDADALRGEDRESVLFDLGLGCFQVDVCIRVADAPFVAELRRSCGRSLFDPGNPAMRAILAGSPPRVFVSRLGRIEVFQAIPPADGQSPEGPHTHVLPKLLATRRSHAATEHVPPGFVPCAHFYPQHPLAGGPGRPAPFDAERHEIFQALIARYGDPGSTTLKRRVVTALDAGEDPSTLVVPDDRQARACVRIALRQYLASHATTATLQKWFAVHDDGFGGKHKADHED